MAQDFCLGMNVLGGLWGLLRVGWAVDAIRQLLYYGRAVYYTKLDSCTHRVTRASQPRAASKTSTSQYKY
jgi:hypothetical protein